MACLSPVIPRLLQAVNPESNSQLARTSMSPVTQVFRTSTRVALGVCSKTAMSPVMPVLLTSIIIAPGVCWKTAM